MKRKDLNGNNLSKVEINLINGTNHNGNMNNDTASERSSIKSNWTEGGHIMMADDVTNPELSVDSLLGSLADKGKFSSRSSIKSFDSQSISEFGGYSMKDVNSERGDLDLDIFDPMVDLDDLNGFGEQLCSTRNNSPIKRGDNKIKETSKDDKLNLFGFFETENRVKRKIGLDYMFMDNKKTHDKSHVRNDVHQPITLDDEVNKSFEGMKIKNPTPTTTPNKQRRSLRLQKKEEEHEISNKKIKKEISFNRGINRKIVNNSHLSDPLNNNTRIQPTKPTVTYGRANRKSKQETKKEEETKEQQLENKKKLFESVDEFELSEETI